MNGANMFSLVVGVNIFCVFVRAPFTVAESFAHSRCYSCKICVSMPSTQNANHKWRTQTKHQHRHAHMRTQPAAATATATKTTTTANTWLKYAIAIERRRPTKVSRFASKSKVASARARELLSGAHTHTQRLTHTHTHTHSPHAHKHTQLRRVGATETYLRYVRQQFGQPARIVRRRVQQETAQHLHIALLDALQFDLCGHRRKKTHTQHTLQSDRANGRTDRCQRRQSTVNTHTLLSPTSPLFSSMYTFRHTYSSICSLMRRNIMVICVIFSTMWPTSSLNCSIEMGWPIRVVRQVCSVSRWVLTCCDSMGMGENTPITYKLLGK